ncbi:amidohydrolase family protein [Virgibacillus sp. NKC19-3]|uniref:metal-dependent hydrolase family protein n=1 Tax=Virgibacillus saliphilus TaxID=2831674 RepID=UPI001C9B664A|nr:amidohydrolase family protein [Virgibacillus sp. NKC19-3]MBY7144501.1 amidohydrolase family protein [Virgibacillus sp. NKC19-3]
MRTILKNCNLIDGISEESSKHAYLIVDNDKIKEVGLGDVRTNAADEVVDCTDKYVLPGLIDAHVHLVWDGSADPQSAINDLENDAITLNAYKHSLDYLKHGITTVRDVGSPDRTTLHVRNAINAGHLQGPTIVSSGSPICMTGGHVYYLGREVDSPDEARKATRTVLKEGADLIKLMATGGIYTFGEEPGFSQLTLEEMKAATQEAHKKGIKVAAHADGLEGILNCIEAGVSTIEHGIYADEHALSLMKEKNMYLVPTMIVMKRLASDDRMVDWANEKAQYVLTPHMEMLKKAVKQGVKIATGTDCGSPVTPPKYYFDELPIMQEAGMTSMEVIQSSTRIAAECLGLDNYGTLAEGKKADLLIVDGNPLDDIHVLKNEKSIMKNGTFI